MLKQEESETFFQMEFTPWKAEQTLQGMELQEKGIQND